MLERTNLDQPPSAAPTIPPFSALLWDNIKTTGVQGGIVVGAVPSIVPAVSMGLLMGAFSCEPMGFVAGGVTGWAITSAVCGVATATVFSVPFTLVASATRKYLPNELIESSIDFIESLDDDELNFTASTILQRKEKLGGFFTTSKTSFDLLSTLEDPVGICNSKRDELSPVEITQRKRKALLGYMQEKAFFDRNAYVNNGKKTLNTILEVCENLKSTIAFRRALKNKTESIMQFSHDDIKDVNWYGDSALHLAVKENSTVFNYLLSKCTDDEFNLLNNRNPAYSFLRLAAEHGMIASILKLIDRTTANKKSDDMQLALGWAIIAKQVDTVRKLVDIYPQLISCRLSQQNNMTPLMLAAELGQVDLVSLLITLTSDLNIKLNCPGNIHHNKTAIQIADDNKHPNVARLLVNAGADDITVNALRGDLQTLIIVLQDQKWTQEGWGLFSNHTPCHIERLQHTLRAYYFSSSIANLDREAVFQLSTVLKENLNDLERDASRSPHARRVYQFVDNLGRNDGNIVADLKGFLSLKQGTAAYRP